MLEGQGQEEPKGSFSTDMSKRSPSLSPMSALPKPPTAVLDAVELFLRSTSRQSPKRNSPQAQMQTHATKRNGWRILPASANSIDANAMLVQHISPYPRSAGAPLDKLDDLGHEIERTPRLQNVASLEHSHVEASAIAALASARASTANALSSLQNTPRRHGAAGLRRNETGDEVCGDLICNEPSTEARSEVETLDKDCEARQRAADKERVRVINLGADREVSRAPPHQRFHRTLQIRADMLAPEHEHAGLERAGSVSIAADVTIPPRRSSSVVSSLSACSTLASAEDVRGCKRAASCDPHLSGARGVTGRESYRPGDLDGWGQHSGEMGSKAALRPHDGRGSSLCIKTSARGDGYEVRCPLNHGLDWTGQQGTHPAACVESERVQWRHGLSTLHGIAETHPLDKLTLRDEPMQSAKLCTMAAATMQVPPPPPLPSPPPPPLPPPPPTKHVRVYDGLTASGRHTRTDALKDARVSRARARPSGIHVSGDVIYDGSSSCLFDSVDSSATRASVGSSMCAAELVCRRRVGSARMQAMEAAQGAAHDGWQAGGLMNFGYRHSRGTNGFTQHDDGEVMMCWSPPKSETPLTQQKRTCVDALISKSPKVQYTATPRVIYKGGAISSSEQSLNHDSLSGLRTEREDRWPTRQGETRQVETKRAEKEALESASRAVAPARQYMRYQLTPNRLSLRHEHIASTPMGAASPAHEHHGPGKPTVVVAKHFAAQNKQGVTEGISKHREVECMQRHAVSAMPGMLKVGLLACVADQTPTLFLLVLPVAAYCSLYPHRMFLS
jgi:hypothetical protein